MARGLTRAPTLEGDVADRDEPLPFELLRGERVLWSGRPSTASFARRVLRVSWFALYFALLAVDAMYRDRVHGLSVATTLADLLPLALLGVTFVGACYGVACAWTRTTRYVITTERCVLRYGIALTGTLSLPWRRIRQVSIALHGDGGGDVALAPKRPHGLRFVQLWPHARGWCFLQPEPMLRCIPRAGPVGALIRQAMEVAADADRVAHTP